MQADSAVSFHPWVVRSRNRCLDTGSPRPKPEATLVSRDAVPRIPSPLFVYSPVDIVRDGIPPRHVGVSVELFPRSQSPYHIPQKSMGVGGS